MCNSAAAPDCDSLALMPQGGLISTASTRAMESTQTPHLQRAARHVPTNLGRPLGDDGSGTHNECRARGFVHLGAGQSGQVAGWLPGWLAGWPAGWMAGWMGGWMDAVLIQIVWYSKPPLSVTLHNLERDRYCSAPARAREALSYPQLPSAAFRCLQLSSAALSYPQLPSGAFRCLELSSAARSCRKLPSAALSCPQLPSGAFSCPELPPGAFRCPHTPHTARHTHMNRDWHDRCRAQTAKQDARAVQAHARVLAKEVARSQKRSMRVRKREAHARETGKRAGADAAGPHLRARVAAEAL
eukprot:364936-Chlamydomonas_euryale.AAC.5